MFSMRSRPHMRRALTLLFAGSLLLVACQAEEDVAIDVGEENPTATEVVTETVTVTETETRTGDVTAGQDPLRDLLVSPQQPVTVRPGNGAEFSLAGRLGEPEADIPRLVGFGWVPCAEVDATQAGALTFPDTGGDGHADRMGESDTGSARLETVNGEAFENVDDEWPTALHTRDEDPPLRLTMRAEQRDCATIVLFFDDDGDEELDLDDDGTPTEVYGVGKAIWEV